MKDLDYVIVGQGLAGSCMAYRMIKAGKNVMVFDECKEQTASLISSGIINPITGRRYVKSWMFDDLLPEALDFYHRVGEELDEKLIKPIELLRALKNVLEENIWTGQSGKEDYKKYFGEIESNDSVSQFFSNKPHFGSVNHSYQVNISKLVIGIRALLQKRNSFEKFKLNIGDIEFGTEIKVHDYSAQNIIFTEGWQVIQNPFFNHLPFDPTKGEVLVSKLENYQSHKVVKNKKFIIPQEDGNYWIGSTNETGISSEETNPTKQRDLYDYLDETLKDKYEVVAHKTAVRPSTKQRRPIVGKHPDYNNVFLLNGLGTKGASLAPYFSKMLFDHIFSQKTILKEVDINNYKY